MKNSVDIYNNFERSDMELFRKFRYSNNFGDTSFSLLYAWGERFDYRFCLYDDVAAFTGTDVDGETGFALVKSSPGSSIDEAFSDICEYCFEKGISPTFEYIDEHELGDYISAAEKIGRKAEYFYMDKYSDYIYDTNEFISMSGKCNKNKRGGYNYFRKYYPDVRYVHYQNDMYDDCMKIFDKWCSSYDCDKCYYGCEKRAFERFMEIYDEEYHKIGMTYIGDKPLSFAVCEQINENTVSYYFQKNSERIRGLTYWLNRQMALEHEKIKFIDLGEDMGLEGLAADKKQLCPCTMLKKYTVKIR